MRFTPHARIAAILAALSLLALAAVGCSTPEPEVIEKIVEVERVVEVEVEVIKEVPVEVVKEVVVEKVVEVPVEVERIVEVEVVKEATLPAPTATPLPQIDIRKSRNISAGGWNDYYYNAYSCGLRESGEAACWGAFGEWNSDEKTIYDDEDRFSARAPSGRFTEISVGFFHTCALNERGSAVCWYHWDPTHNEGFNYGQANAPGNRFAAISAGGFHTCALSEDGEAACWGADWSGRTEVPDGIYMAISAGESHTCALRDNGDAECWGSNRSNQALDVQGQRFVTISAGGEHNCALRADGTGACWGGSEGSEIVPIAGPFKTISAGWKHTCALYEDGAATCWGEGGFGQSSPPGGSFAEIAAGYDNSCGLRHNGEVVCWGNNLVGQSSPARGRFATSDRSARALPASPSYDSFDAATILTRFSTADALEGEARADAASEIIALHQSGDADAARVLDLLHTIAPELLIDERRRAADKLAQISDDGKWDERETANGVFYLASVITGEEPNPEERVEAARAMVALYETGDLDADTALNLMDTIAPGLDINQRRQAATALARLAADDDWDDADRMTAANETFRLVTGVPLDAEQRIGGAVDLAGVGVKIFDTDDSFDDRDIDNATAIIKQAISGDLTSDSLLNILALGD